MHTFTVWAPIPEKVAVKIEDRVYPMQGPNRLAATGRCEVQDAGPGTDYGFLLDDDETGVPRPAQSVAAEWRAQTFARV